MAVTIDPQDGIIFKDQNPILFPSDGNYRPSAMLAGFDPGDNIVLAEFTADRRLRVDAALTIGNLTIGEVSVQGLDAGGIMRDTNTVANPDSLTFALFTQDQRMTFSAASELKTLSRVADAAGLIIDPSTEQTLNKVFFAVGGLLTPITRTFTRNANDEVITVAETDGLHTVTSTITRDPQDNVTSVAEVYA